MNVEILVCQIIGPAATGSAGPVPTPLGAQSCCCAVRRDQTEEWKGWMQVMFVWYHYFAAKEWYNWIRIYIACYVWMTGFGIESITIVGVFWLM